MKYLRALLVSSFLFIFGLPSAFAAIADPLYFLGNVINDVFNGSFLNISEDVFIRFAYWITLFTIVYFVGVQRAFKSFNSDDNKGVAKKMGMMISLVLATTATVFTPIETLRFVFQLYSGILVFIVMFAIFGYLFKLCYGKDALKDYSPLAVRITRALVIIALLISIILGRQYAGLESIFGFRAFEYVDPFMTIIQIILVGMLIKELFFGWSKSGGSGGSSGGGSGGDGGGSGGSSGSGGGSTPSGGSGASGPSGGGAGDSGSPAKRGWFSKFFASPEEKELKAKIGKFKELVKEYQKQATKINGYVGQIGTHPAPGSAPTGIASNSARILEVNKAAEALSFVQKAMYEAYNHIALNEHYPNLSKKVRADFQTTAISMNESVVTFLTNYKTIQSSIYPQVQP